MGSPLAFPLVLQAEAPGESILSLSASRVEALLAEHQLVVFRGYSLLEDQDYVRFGRQFGSLLAWEFGEILDLGIRADPENHIFSAGRVELHWDGAFVEKRPHYNLFQCLTGCDEAAGGETLFVNTPRVFQTADSAERALWAGVMIRYSTEKKAHYGGTFTEGLLSKNPHTGKDVIRFIEAFNEDNEALNPMEVKVNGYSDAESERFLRDFTRRLYRDDVMYRHHWRSGDFLMADNCTLLHGRSRFVDPSAKRHIKRINIL